MSFDFKKEFKELYMPKPVPTIINIPTMKYLAVRGNGDPNTEGGDYKKSIEILYALSYTIKMSYKGCHNIEGFYEYVVPPLEGFWRQEGKSRIDYSDKSRFSWISLIRIPDFVTDEHFEWASVEVKRKKDIDCSCSELLTVNEGLCVQMMHIGPYDDEPESIALMDKYILENGYSNDISKARMHHEIYLSDPRRTAPEKLKTVIRHPIIRTIGE